MCAERNMCSKSLIEARDEITEMKRKLKIMSHQIDQLKEEIAAKVHIYCIHVIRYTLCVCVCVCVCVYRSEHWSRVMQT